ncbi:MAG: NAD(P)/FAD-dependent oxidoreductase [Proteobacteria bacterium]|nr:NAD(P)/FAD-dependent oxidoreductase [Pseudomonadota bacterium]
MDDVLIVGAGPAGMATAIQLKRYGLTPRLFEKSRPGGLICNANWVENYPGFAGGISGPELADIFIEQVKPIKITQESVIELSWKEGLFEVITVDTLYQAKFAVIASGTKPKVLTGFSVFDELKKNIVYDLNTIKDQTKKNIIIIGSGDIAFDYALNLAKKNSVIILNHSDQTKCLKRLKNQAEDHQNIVYSPKTKIEKVEKSLEGDMIVECSSPFGLKTFRSDYIVGAIGRDPQIDFISSSVMKCAVEYEEKGILHFVGDVKNGLFRQAAIAVGDGVRAGMLIHQTIEENEHESRCIHR